MSVLIDLMEVGLLPDAVIRRGIRRLLKLRLQNEYHVVGTSAGMALLPH